MAFVDLFGATSGGVEGHLDITHRRFEPVMDELLPRGPAWDPEDPVRQAIVAAECTEFSRVDVRADALARELDPHTTFALIGDWELELGLPECAAPVTLEARRAAVLAKLLAEGGHNQSWVWWKDALEALGYPPKFFLQGQDALDCNDDCLDDCKDEEWPFIWQIFVFNGLDDALVVCFVNHNALLGTLALVHFMWQRVLVIVDSHDLFGVACTDDGYVSVVGNDGFSLFAGADYDKETGWDGGPALVEDIYAVASIGNVLVACGASPGNFIRSIDHGESWISSGDATSDMYAVTRGIGEGVAVAGGEDGDAWRSVDHGEHWTQVTTIGETILGLTRCSGAVLAVTAAGRVHRSVDNGTSWISVGSTEGTPLLGAGGWQQVAVAVGAAGVILRSSDAGVSFAPVASPTTATLRGVVGNAAGRWTACGDGGVILQSVDHGVTWTVQLTPTTETLYAVTRHVPTDRAIVAGANISIIVE